MQEPGWLDLVGSYYSMEHQTANTHQRVEV